MTIDSFDAIFYTAIFVLPGFVMNLIVDSINPSKKQSENVYFLKFLLYSIISCSCLSWAYKIVADNISNTDWYYWLALIGVSIVGSSAIAILIAIIKQKRVIESVFGWFKIKTIDPTPEAWDYIFAQQKISYVIITLQDDTKIKGLYSTNSFTSSDSENRDMFIEKIYYKKDNEEWVEDVENNGIYIAKDQIKYIEFMRGQENE